MDNSNRKSTLATVAMAPLSFEPLLDSDEAAALLKIHPVSYTHLKEGADEVALLSETGAPVLASSGTARSKDKGGILKLDLDVSRVHPGQYFLGLRQPGEEWTRYPVRVI